MVLTRTLRQLFSLELNDHGPYVLDHTRDGRYTAFAGERGHIAMLDRYSMGLKCEFVVNEAIRDIK